MAKTAADNKKSTNSEYVTLEFKKLTLPWAIVLSVIIFTAGMGSALYFGLKARPVVDSTGTAGTGADATVTYAASEFAEVSLPFTGGPEVGKENAKVVILEFSDLVCPYCKKFHDDTYGKLYDTYIKNGQVKMVYKHYPLSFHNPAATLASKASYCVETNYGNEKMYAFHDAFFKNVNSVTQNAYDSNNNPLINLKDTAFDALFGQLGMDASKIRGCMNSAAATDRLAKDATELTDFQTDIVNKGLSQGLGTPSFVIGVVKNGVLTGRLIEGAYPIAAFQNVIEEQLKK